MEGGQEGWREEGGGRTGFEIEPAKRKEQALISSAPEGMTLEGIFYSEFDNLAGPRIAMQYPEG